MRPALRALSRRGAASSATRSATATDVRRARSAQVDDVLDRQRGRERRRSAACRSAAWSRRKYAAARPERDVRARRRLDAVAGVDAVAGAGAVPGAVRGARRRRFSRASPGRMWPEIAAAIDGWPSRLRFCAEHVARIAAAPIVPAADGRAHAAEPRHRARGRLRARARAGRSSITGEPELDRVVPVELDARVRRRSFVARDTR